MLTPTMTKVHSNEVYFSSTRFLSMTLPEMRNITKCRESRFLSLTILDTHLVKVSLRKVSIESISYIIGLYSCCSQIHLKSTWLKLSVIFSFSLISSKPANGLRSFLPNSSLCLTLDNPFSKRFSLYCNGISFISSEKHSTKFGAFT